LFDIQNRNYIKGVSPKIPEISRGRSNGTEIPDKKFAKISVYFASMSPFSEIQENSGEWYPP